MTPHEITARIKELGVERQRVEDERDALKDDLERQAKREIAKFPGLYALLSVTYAGVNLYVYNYKGVQIMEGGGWGKQDPSDDSKYGIPLERGPMEWAEFDANMQAMANHLACPLDYSTLKRRAQGGIQTIAALQMLHPGKTVKLIVQGKVEYVGWDIGDPYYEATIDGQLWAFWGEGAHGGGITQSAQHGTPDWERYESFRAGGE